MPEVKSSSDEVRPTLVIDISGCFCPGPVIEAGRAINRIGLGEAFELVTTDEGTWRDIPAWCRNTGNTLLAADNASCSDDENGERQYRFVIRRDH